MAVLDKSKRGPSHRIRAMRFDAMSLNISPDDGHPNKMPFSGILVRLDEPSDAAPGGAGGRPIIVTRAAAERALGSLLGMAVDFTPSFDGHDTQSKVGIITSATIEGNAVHIEGFVYAADFPEVAADIKALQSVLGFSFEAQRLIVADPSAPVLTITEMAFTGAAILRKDKAAYQTTSLAAAADKEFPMAPEELKALLAEAVKPLSDRLDKIESEKTDKVEASRALMDRVEPHAAALEACHASMEAAGIGVHPTQGHGVWCSRLAGSLRAAAAVGQIPHIFRDHEYPMSASAGESDSGKLGKLIQEQLKAAGVVKEDKDMTEDDVKKAVDAAMKPILDKLAAAETQVKDLQAAAKAASPPPERKTVPPMISSILAKAGLELPTGDEKLSMAALDKALTAANLPTDKRIMLKSELGRLGAL